MNIHLVIPLPIFFFYLIIKLIIVLAIPFALGLIVRIRSQASDKKKVKAEQNSDKVAPPQPSPSSDGEDKPEESYWTRFKRWCSEHSLAIGLGISLVAATLIYIYREDISSLIYDSQPEEDKKALEPFQPISEEKKAVAEKAIAMTKEICDTSFFAEGEELDGETFVRKSKAVGQQIVEICNHYSSLEKINQSQRLNYWNIRVFRHWFPEVIEKFYLSDEELEEAITFANNQLSKKVEDRDPSFNNEFMLLTKHKAGTKGTRWYDHFFEIVFIYVLKRLEEDPVATSDKK